VAGVAIRDLQEEVVEVVIRGRQEVAAEEEAEVVIRVRQAVVVAADIHVPQAAEAALAFPGHRVAGARRVPRNSRRAAGVVSLPRLRNVPAAAPEAPPRNSRREIDRAQETVHHNNLAAPIDPERAMRAGRRSFRETPARDPALPIDPGISPRNDPAEATSETSSG